MTDAPETNKQTSKEKILAKATEHLKNAEAAQEAASEAQKRADETSSDEEKQHALHEVKELGEKATTELKAAQRLQSGVWQGGVGGAGIGAGVGMGVGTAVGTLVGGVTAIPTTGVGLLAGAGTGALHGPWFKIGKDEKNNAEDEGRDKTTRGGSK